MVRELKKVETTTLFDSDAVRFDVVFVDVPTKEELYLAVLLPVRCSAQNFIERMRNALDDLEAKL